MSLTAFRFICDEFPEFIPVDPEYDYLLHALTEFEDNGTNYQNRPFSDLVLLPGEWVEDYAERFADFLPGFNAKHHYPYNFSHRRRGDDPKEVDWDIISRTISDDSVIDENDDFPWGI